MQKYIHMPIYDWINNLHRCEDLHVSENIYWQHSFYLLMVVLTDQKIGLFSWNKTLGLGALCKTASYKVSVMPGSLQREYVISHTMFNTLRPRQNGRHLADDIFKWIFLNENIWISLKISLKFVPEVRINNIPALVQIMAWRRPGDKPLSEPMLVISLTHICVTRPQWVNHTALNDIHFQGCACSIYEMHMLTNWSQQYCRHFVDDIS